MFLDQPWQPHKVNQPTNTEHPKCEEVEDAPQRSVQVEVMQTEESKWHVEHVGVIQVSLAMKTRYVKHLNHCN